MEWIWEYLPNPFFCPSFYTNTAYANDKLFLGICIEKILTRLKIFLICMSCKHKNFFGLIRQLQKYKMGVEWFLKGIPGFRTSI